MKSNKKKIAVSACLLGVACRYNGTAFGADLSPIFEELEIVPICPEQMGGLPTPRTPCEIVGGDGNGVLEGTASIIDKEGIDRTLAFVKGAELALERMKTEGVKIAVLKSRSPSCGFGTIYSGAFSGELKKGDGVVAALFKKMGIILYDEDTCLKLKEMNTDEKVW